MTSMFDEVRCPIIFVMPGLIFVIPGLPFATKKLNYN